MQCRWLREEEKRGFWWGLFDLLSLWWDLHLDGRHGWYFPRGKSGNMTFSKLIPPLFVVQCKAHFRQWRKKYVPAPYEQSNVAMFHNSFLSHFLTRDKNHPFMCGCSPPHWNLCCVCCFALSMHLSPYLGWLHAPLAAVHCVMPLPAMVQHSSCSRKKCSS